MTVLEDPNAARILARWLNEPDRYPGEPDYPGDPTIHPESQWRLLRSYFDRSIDDDLRKMRGEEPPADAPEPVTPLEAIVLNRLISESLQASRWFLIYDARKAGYSWEHIGKALGVTRQTAHKVYSEDLQKRATWWEGRCGADRFAQDRPEYESVLRDGTEQ